MRIEVRPLDFEMREGFTMSQPRDMELFGKAEDYCRRQLAAPLDLRRLGKAWVVLDDNGDVIGVSGFVLKADIPVFRVTGENARRATKALYDRMNAFFADQGMTGQEVFLHISSKETPEQRCAEWQDSLQSVNAIPADRFALIVR